MKRLTLLTIIALFSYSSISQSILNGDFENNYVDSCSFNLTNSQFNDSIQNIFSYGLAEQTDIQTFGCYVSPQHGDWCIGLASEENDENDAVTMELSSNLNIGDSYEIIFWTFGNTQFHPLMDSIKIGITSSNNNFGKKVYTTLPTENIWEENKISFTADSDYSFISIEIKEDFNSNSWYQIDNFTISNTTGIDQNTFKTELSIYPNPAKNRTNIDLGNSYSNIYLRIMTLEGQIRISKQFNDLKSISLDISDLKSGLYIVEINTLNNQTNIKLLKK